MLLLISHFCLAARASTIGLSGLLRAVTLLSQIYSQDMGYDVKILVTLSGNNQLSNIIYNYSKS